MLRLHGFASSNYHNVVKLALIEKGVAFEEMTAYPPADEAYASKNPTGRYPCLEVDEGSFLGESKVILNYLEDAFPEPRLLPKDPLERALARELMEVIDLYLEWPARRLYPEALFGDKVSDEVKAEVRLEMARGIAGLEQRARFDPYILGAELSMADLSAAIHLPLFSITTKAIYGEDLLAAIPAVSAHRKLMGERQSMQRVKTERRDDLSRFMQHRIDQGQGS
jgi:glutathione S-transferase